MLLRTGSEKEEDGTRDRIKNGGSDIVRGQELYDRTCQKAGGRRKVEISGLHLLNTSNVEG